MNDSEITRCVQILLALLHEEPNLVQTEVEDGVVYLHGVASSEPQKHHIADAIGYVAGYAGWSLAWRWNMSPPADLHPAPRRDAGRATPDRG